MYKSKKKLDKEDKVDMKSGKYSSAEERKEKKKKKGGK